VSLGRAPAQRITLGNDRVRQAVEECPHVGPERRGELVEGALEMGAKRRRGQRFEDRPTEVEGAQLGPCEAGRDALERLAARSQRVLPLSLDRSS